MTVDILPDADFVRQHWAWHSSLHTASHVGVLGRVTWHDELEITPLLRWLETSGEQFAYGKLRDGDLAPYGCLYTSDVSFKRAFLMTCDEWFDERLTGAGLEDSEWGYRLARKGMELRYNSGAIGKHLHPTTLDSALRRTKTLASLAAALEVVNRDEFDRVTGGLFRPERRLKRAIAIAILNSVFLNWVYTPLARLCERRLVAGPIYAAAFASAMWVGLQGARTDPGTKGRPNAAPLQVR